MLPAQDGNTAPAGGQVDAKIDSRDFTARDVEAILRERGWLEVPCSVEISEWLSDAAERLKASVAAPANASESIDGGEGCTSRDVLSDLLSLIFEYDAAKILAASRSHIVLTRAGAHTVIRELANRVLQGPALDSDGYQLLVAALQEKMGFSGRGLFHPIRLALAGSAGEEAIDCVIPLIDRAALLPFSAAVKSTRQRMLEFCAVMD